MNRFNKPEEIAYTRAKILNPLLDPALDHTARVALRRKISEQEGISERTLRRWWKDYKAEGFSGLIPKLRETPSRNAIPEAIVDEAVLLRREIPERSVRDIIHLLELEGRISPGSIKRSSLQARLEERGYGARQLKMYASSGAGAHRRFEYQERNGLWQADIKYLLHLQGDAKNAGKQLYVSAFIDDATRMVTACRVYDRQDAPAVLDSFRAALAIYGVPERLFTDNGKPYVSKAMHQVCQSLGIHLLRAKPYAAASKGKIEAFNRTLEKFVQEAQLERPKSIAQVQHDLDCWLENFYYTQPHSALKGKTPRQAFNEQIRPLRFLTIEQLNEAFLYKECRLVEKPAVFHFKAGNGKRAVSISV